MATVLLDEVETGAKLAADVADRQGRVLLKSGVTLNQNNIRTLQAWGVLEVEIEGDGNEHGNLEVYPDEWLAEAEDKASTHFKHCPVTHAFIEELAKQWKLRYLKNKEV